MPIVARSVGQTPTNPPAEGVVDAKGNTSPAWQVFFGKQAQALADASWAIGDYRQTASPSLGPNWLLCNGAMVDQAAYPALAAIIVPLVGNTATATQFPLPTVPSIYTDINNAVAIMQTFIKAL